MNSDAVHPLLTIDDPAPFQILNPGGTASLLLLGDHAGNLIPIKLDSLGIDAAQLGRHIGWDIGIAGLGERLSARLDATFVHQTYSRLVIDCNRDPARADAVPEVSDGTIVPGNAALSPADRAGRVAAIHAPYQAAITDVLAERDAAERETVLVSLHSFTPAMQGVARPWPIGLLYSEGDISLSRAMLAHLQRRGDLTVGDNEPYAMDGIDYTVPRHAFAAGRRYVEIEIRQDLLATQAQQDEWAALLAEVLVEAMAEAG